MLCAEQYITRSLIILGNALVLAGTQSTRVASAEYFKQRHADGTE